MLRTTYDLGLQSNGFCSRKSFINNQNVNLGSKTGFLNLDSIDVRSWVLLARVGMPCHCWKFKDILRFSTQQMSVVLVLHPRLPSIVTNTSLDIAESPLGKQNFSPHPSVGTHSSKMWFWDWVQNIYQDDNSYYEDTRIWDGVGAGEPVMLFMFY